MTTATRRPLSSGAAAPRSIELRGRAGRRLRVGDHRVIYEVDDELVVTVLGVGHRRDA